MAMYDLCEICGGFCVAPRHEPVGCQELPDCLAIPCPFCGSKQVSSQEDSQTAGKWGFVGCGCGARGPDVRTGYDFTPRAEWRADAVSQWNLCLTIPSEGLGRQQALASEIECILTRLPVRDCVDIGGELDCGRIREAAREIAAFVTKAQAARSPAASKTLEALVQAHEDLKAKGKR